MKAIAALPLLACLFLAACMPDQTLFATSSRFAIESYQTHDDRQDLTGLWMTIHNGRLDETIDDIDYEITGNIREIVAITRVHGDYYLRTCVQPGTLRPMSLSGSQVSVQMNDDLAELTIIDNARLSGTASHDWPDSRYDGTVEMKKIAAAGDTFGHFGFYRADGQAVTATADCFQEGDLHVVGSQSIFSQWADVEILSVASLAADDSYRQTAYLTSREGTADPARKLVFTSGGPAVDPTVQQFPIAGENIAIGSSTASVNAFNTSLAVDSFINADIAIYHDMATANTVTAVASDDNNTTTTDGSFDWSDLGSEWGWDWWSWLLP